MPPQTSSSLPPLPPAKKHLPINLILGILLVAAIAFGAWAFSSRQSIKSEADKKLATANTNLTQAASDQAAAEKANDQPYKTFSGPALYGSVSFKYPKSWSAYVDQTGTTDPIEGYFYPGVVPGIQSDTAFALRVELQNTDYSDVLSQFQPDIQNGSVKASAYIPPKMKGVKNAQAGTKLTGQISQDPDNNPQNGVMVILKVRSTTLQIYTESPNYVDDLNTVLGSLTYSP